jgi:hypothetical protein
VERLFPGVAFDPGIPTQLSITGVEHGARPVRPDEALAYMKALAEVSPRARWIEYARSYEDRPLGILAVGEEATIASLDAFRKEHGAALDPRVRTRPPEGAVAVAWMAYGIHGDELSSTDAAMALAYRLVAGEDDWAKRMRAGVLVLIDPCENPDGRERYLAMSTAFGHRVPNPDLEDLSHTGAWPWGRGNHYLFDLNRDWFSQIHPESARSGLIADWVPQLMVDSHEMGANSSYLFPPPRAPFNTWQPQHNIDWLLKFSADQAKALDKGGYPYFTREWNEEFFPGYGSSWATYLGSVGVLYEMSRTSGTWVRKHTGETRTFPQAVEHHLISSLANLGSLLADKDEILGDSWRSRKAAIDAGKNGRSAWILPASRYPDRAELLAQTLAGQGIEVRRLNERSKKALSVIDARSGYESSQKLPAGSLLIPLNQPAGWLARVLLDPHLPMRDEFLREQREYLERGKGSRLYDTTAWSMLLSYGVEAWWTEAPAAELAKLGEPWQKRSITGSTAMPSTEDRPIHAFAFAGNSDLSSAALAALLQDKVHVRISEKPFRIAGRDWPRGTLLVPREGNPTDVADRVQKVMDRHGLQAIPLYTARAQQGPDLGGSHFPMLIEPRVGVWTGMPISPSDYGALWHLFDVGLGLRFSGLDIASFGRTDLSRYNVLVFPNAYGSYRSLLGESGIAALKEWVDAGGTAVGIAGGARFLADEEVGLTQTRLRSQALDRYPPAVWSIPAREAEAAGRFRAVGIAPTVKDEDEDENERATVSKRSSPYDVAPVIGDGARRFLAGVPQGTPLETFPMALSDWTKPWVASGEKPDDAMLQRADARLRSFSPEGAFLRVDLDGEHWLNWGIPGDALDVLNGSSDALVAEPPVQVPVRYAGLERLHLGGLLWPEAAARISNTAYMTRESHGRGQVILFLDTPIFRAWTLGTRRLLVNSVLYGPGLGTRWSTPW